MRLLHTPEKKPRAILSITLLYMLLIFALSSIPYPQQPIKGVVYLPVIEHIIEFTVLGILLSSTIASTTRYDRKKIFIISLILGSLYGLTDEFHQFFVPGRVCELGDFLADAVGVFIGSSARVIKPNPGPGFSRSLRHP